MAGWISHGTAVLRTDTPDTLWRLPVQGLLGNGALRGGAITVCKLALINLCLDASGARHEANRIAKLSSDMNLGGFGKA